MYIYKLVLLGWQDTQVTGFSEGTIIFIASVFLSRMASSIWNYLSAVFTQNQPQTLPLLNLMEEEPLYGGRALNSTLSTTTAAACLLHHPTISNSLNRSLTLSLSRYTARLIAGEHQIVVGDFPELRSDRIDWTYTKHFVLDVIWNLPFFLVSVCVLLLASNEKSSTALRVWISGYALQCLLRLGFTFAEYLTRNFADQDWVFSSQSRRRIVKKLESVNTTVSSFWWLLGVYFVVDGGPAYRQDSPILYWLTVVFLFCDVFFMILCLVVGFTIFLALFICLPISAIIHAMTIREGASEEDIKILPKYMFRQSNSIAALSNDKEPKVFRTMMESDNSTSICELCLHPEDSECCICLSQYVDGAELYTLPCNHHFHCECIGKWLRLNATCPLCKFNILKSDELVWTINEEIMRLCI